MSVWNLVAMRANCILAVPAGLILLSTLFSAPPSESELSEGGEWFYELHQGGTRIGTSRVFSALIGDNRLETTSNVRFQLTRGPQIMQVTLNARTVYRWPGGRPLDYAMTFVGGRVPIVFTGVFGEAECLVNVKTGPEEYTRRIPSSDDLYILDQNFLIDHYLVMLASIPLDKASEIHYLVPQTAQQSPRVFGMRLKPRGIQEFIGGGQVWEGLKLECISDTGIRMAFWVDPEKRTLLRWTVPSESIEVILARDVGTSEQQ